MLAVATTCDSDSEVVMPIAGLVVTLVRDPAGAESAERAIASDRRFTLGQSAGRRLPVVVDTGDAQGCETLHRELESIPGVDRVDVVFIETRVGSEGTPMTRDCFAPAEA